MARRRAPAPARFVSRHVGPSAQDTSRMLSVLGLGSLEELADALVPGGLPALPPPPAGTPSPALDEAGVLAALRGYAADNDPHVEMIGAGYYPAHTPAVIARDVLSNPAWTTSYTPYQAEISQGRLEAQLLFQTVVSDLTGLPVACASLLDEATAVTEAMMLMVRAQGRQGKDLPVLLDLDLHPQCVQMAVSRAYQLDLPVIFADLTGMLNNSMMGIANDPLAGVVLAQASTRGALHDLRPLVESVHARGGLVAVDVDPLAATLLTPPGELGADIAVGSAQRLGAPLFYGGPHAGFMSVTTALTRQLPGRIVGVSRDRDGAPALRLALQTREQHIRRQKATSNICTAQALMAVVSAMYCVHHGPEGLTAIATRIHEQAADLASRLEAAGLTLEHRDFFDTLSVYVPQGAAWAVARAADRGVNIRHLDTKHVGISINELTTTAHLDAVVSALTDTDSPKAKQAGPGHQGHHDTASSPKAGARRPVRPRTSQDTASSAESMWGVAMPANPDPVWTAISSVCRPVSVPGTASSPKAEPRQPVRPGISLDTAGSAGAEAPREPGAPVRTSIGTAAWLLDWTPGWRRAKAAAGPVDTDDTDGSPADAFPLPADLRRTSSFLTHPVFHAHRCEASLTRYLRTLADRDLALDRTMVPLGSCTLKLNAAVESATWLDPALAGIHPLAPASQTRGWRRLLADLSQRLARVTGYDRVSLQPASGAQGELAGLLAIRGYLEARGQGERDVCLVPASAHGTNAASAAAAGLRVVAVGTAPDGSVDVADLEARLAAHAGRVAAIMLTYPSTHGVFEKQVRHVTDLVHAAGGQVYIDGANLNALCGLLRPGDLGGDVSHLNLHKTFALPHGGGGPGVGPVAAKAHLVPYLPAGHNESTAPEEGDPDAGFYGDPVAGARFGSAGLAPLSWAYLALMDDADLRRATLGAVAAANYLSRRLAEAYPTLYTGPGGLVAHECVLDLRKLTRDTGVTAEDVAKRLIDLGFHAPTLSFPVAGTLMVEPTESEPLEELDRFVAAMTTIRAEIDDVAAGRIALEDSPLRLAPHTLAQVTAEEWTRSYPRTQGVWPGTASAARRTRYFPPVTRVDNAWGDRHLVCTYPTPQELPDTSVS